MEGIGEGINKPNGKIHKYGKIEDATDRIIYRAKNRDGDEITLYMLREEYLQNLDPMNLEKELTESIRLNLDYLFEKYDFSNPDKWAFIYGLFWYVTWVKNDFKRSVGIRNLDNYVYALYFDKIEEIEKGEVRIKIKMTIETLESNKNKASLVNKDYLTSFLSGYNVEVEDIKWFLDHLLWSLNTFIKYLPNFGSNRSKNAQILRITPIKTNKDGISYYYAVRLTDRDVSKVKVEIGENQEVITDIVENWFAYPVKIYCAIKDPNTKKWYYDIQIDDERALLRDDEVKRELIQKGYGIKEYRVKEAFGNILHGLRINGQLKEIKAHYIAPGVYLREDGLFDFAVTMEDGVFPSSSSNAKQYQEILERKGLPNNEGMRDALEFILKVLSLEKDPVKRINTILLFGWGMMAPFNYIYRSTGRMGYYFINYGVKNSGKSLRALLLSSGYGGFNAPGGDTFEAVFRLGLWAETSTFPILADDITGLSEKVLKQLKGGIEGTTITERGTPDQHSRKYQSLASFFFTCQDIDWLIKKRDKEASAQKDRFIIGLEETKKRMVKDLNSVEFKGVSYSGEALREMAKKLPPWALRIIKDFVNELNEEHDRGVKGISKLDKIQANINEAIRLKLLELGVGEDLTTRDLEKLTRIYMGITVFLNAVKRYLPNWEDYYDDLNWLFDMDDLPKFVRVMAKNWLGILEFSSIFEAYLLDIKKAYEYYQAYNDEYLNTYTKKANLISKTGYSFNDDIIKWTENELIITSVYIREAKEKFEKMRMGTYSTLRSFAKDYAKAMNKDLSDVYMVSPKEIYGKRPRVMKILMEDIYTYLSKED